MRDLRIGTAVALFVFSSLSSVIAQPPQCDPAKVIGPMRCASCHENEVRVWLQTPHAKTLEELHRRPEANAIAAKMGIRSIKRGDVCLDCHYTSQSVSDKNQIIAGVSCESCHGAALDWVTWHNDYGGPTVLKSQESAAHKEQRREISIAHGMRNPTNVYLVARSCLQCHSVPNEKLINVGGHGAGSLEFEMVSWSQGINRHNFLRTENKSNAENSAEELRIMFVAGLMADLEFSTRAVAKATERGVYGFAVAQRAANVAVRLQAIQEQINDPNLQQALVAFSRAVLKTNNETELNAIADEIQQAGTTFAKATDGSKLAALDAMIPNKSQYK
ncbi:MAG: cytochrome c family protein [Pirellulaceae bacterium]|nr:cytochrome c family protein [Pirellulaceae bacterium]